MTCQLDECDAWLPALAGGKYPVAFKLDLARAVAQELLSVSPEEGSIEPGKEVTVQVGAWATGQGSSLDEPSRSSIKPA